MKALYKFLKEKSIPYVFIIMFSLILLPRNIKSLAIALFSLTILIHAVIKKNKINWRFFLINSSVYIFIIGTFLYSHDTRQASLKLQTMLSLFLFPLVFSLISKENYTKIYNHKEKLLQVYIYSVLLFNLIIFIGYCINDFAFFNVIKHYVIIVNERLHKYNIHPIYLSIHLCISLIFSFYLYSKKRKIITLISIILLFFFLFILMRKGPILSLILILLYSIIFLLKRKLKIITSISLIILVVSSFLVVPKVKSKFSEILNIEKLTEKNMNSTNIRAEIYKSSLKPIKESLFLGYGIGDFNSALINSYKNKVLIRRQFNAHNQYISFLLIGGLFLLSIFLLVQFYNIRLSYANNNYLFIIICLFYLFNMMTESILERENGVIYFSFFICFFSLKNYILDNEK